MKKIRIGIVEILGFIGLILWTSTVLLRSAEFPITKLIFVMGVLPNLAAAWCVTMFFKWFVDSVLHKDITVKTHFLICLSILIIAIISEIVHHVFFGSFFDKYDILATVIAQLIIFVLPAISRKEFIKQ